MKPPIPKERYSFIEGKSIIKLTWRKEDIIPGYKKKVNVERIFISVGFPKDFILSVNNNIGAMNIGWFSKNNIEEIKIAVTIKIIKMTLFLFTLITPLHLQ